jgi:hypothetical protein
MASIHKEHGGLLNYAVESPVSTGVNLGSIQAPVTGQWLDKDMQYSIGAQPDNDFTKQIFDLVTGSVGAAPMAVGKITKASITGGQSIGGYLKNWLKKHSKDSSPPSDIPADIAKQWHIKGKMPKEAFEKADDMMGVDKIIHNNKLSKAQLDLMNAREKAGMPFQPFHWDKGHHLYKPETADEYVDIVTYYLNKINRN